MLRLTAERAGIEDGHRILELGCGWGSFSLWAAEHFPASQVVGVSNSASQREFILGEARRRGLANVEIVTCDMNRFEAPGTFDRVVSVEMFEHMRNWPELFRRISGWLEPGRQALRPRLRERPLRLPLRDRGRRRLDGAPLLHRRDDALPRPAPARGRSARRRGGLGRARARTTRGRRRPGTRTSSPTSTRPWRRSPARSPRPRRACRCAAGRCSSWPAPSSSASTAAASGRSPTTGWSKAGGSR